MYQSSQAFGDLIQKDSRTFQAKLVVDQKDAITEGIRDIKFSGASNSDTTFIIGSAISQYVEITLGNPPMELENHEIEVFIGMDVGGTLEYIPMGLYTVEKPEKDEDSITFTAYDHMLATDRTFISSLPETTTAIAVLNEMSQFLKIDIITAGLMNYGMKKPSGYTCRELLSYISQMYAGFAICNRKGQIEVKCYQEIDYTITTSRYWDSFKHNDFPYDYLKISCYTGKDDKGKDIVISAGSGVRKMSISNPFMTQDILNLIHTSLMGFSYMPGSFRFLGDPRLDPWDTVKVLDRYGNLYKVPCMKLVQDYDGGLTTEVEAFGESETENEQGFQGPQTQLMDRYEIKLALIDYAVINKLDVDTANITYAKIKDLDAINAIIQNLDAVYAKITNLNAVNAKIENLEANYGNIHNLLSGNAGIGDLVNIKLTTVNATIENALIRNAVMQSVTINDLLAGTISTNKFTVASDDGGIVIAGATQQWKDKNGVVRMQAGKDAVGNFTFSLFDPSGRGTLIDAMGIHAGAVPSGLIINDMVADNAAINAGKIDKLSLETVINSGGIKILGSTVKLDTSGQTLDVAFNQIHDEINGIVSEDGTYILQTYVEGGGHVGDTKTSTIYARVFVKNADATKTIPPYRFLWSRSSEYTKEDAAWNAQQITGYSLTLQGKDVDMSADFQCMLTIPEEYSIATITENSITDLAGNELLALFM